MDVQILASISNPAEKIFSIQTNLEFSSIDARISHKFGEIAFAIQLHPN